MTDEETETRKAWGRVDDERDDAMSSSLRRWLKENTEGGPPLRGTHPNPSDKINPPHYASLTPEPIDVIEGWELGFCLGAALKYIARAGKKPGEDPVTDLRKALWFIERRIKELNEARG